MNDNKYYVNYNKDGSIAGFYNSKVNKKIPESAVEITRSEWEDLKEYELRGRFKPSYADKRRNKYIELDGEAIKAIRLEIDAIRSGEEQTAEYTEYREKIENIKSEIPKE